MEADDAMT